jgi:hypothetical protein
MEIPVQIPNATKEITTQVSDPNTFWLVLVTLILAGITFFGILLANKRTRESIELTKKELDSKIRAWLRIEFLEPSHVILKDDSAIPQDEYWRNMGKYTSPIVAYDYQTEVTNIGSLPAMNVRGKFLESFNKFSRDEFENYDKSNPLPLMPGESFPKVVTISKETYEKSATTPYYIGLLVEYNLDDKTIAKVGKIWQLKENLTSIIDSWI